jgi:hypothetical protein
LVGVNIDPVKRSHTATMCAKWFHACHPERSRLSGVAKDLHLDRPRRN